VLRKLRDKAITVYAKGHGDQVDSEATLDVLAGRTRVIAQTIHLRNLKTAADPDAPIDPALVRYFSADHESGRDSQTKADLQMHPNTGVHMPPIPFFDVPQMAIAEDEDGYTKFLLHEPQWAEFLQNL
jgi:hypothetical protein